MPGSSPATANGMNFARSAKSALRDWQDTIAGACLCKAGRTCHNGDAGAPLARP